EGVTGQAGPIQGMDQAFAISQQLAPLLLGHDPLATERIWDRLYRFMVHGRKGVVMQAISVVDCALWDLKGKWAGVPVYRLLGGPTRETIPAYASALGYSLEPELVRERVKEIVAQGYRATKWFPRHGPADGPEGIAKNLELVRTLREAAGPGVDIMLDCWMSWDVPYTIQMARRLEEYQPRWIEEPVLPDKIEQCAEIRRNVRIPIATGEHEYTRWGLKALMDAKVADVLQPDVFWAGGISETMKICALASAYDLVVIPHGHSVPATVHIIAAQPVATCPLLEYLIKWNEVNQFFFKNPIKPVGGSVTLPTGPGMGVELDEDRIESRLEVKFK
ncbi:MAG: mandelate racemase/muconate lactonizing protein, partial [Deinococcus sp.]|nr:mandelate racemase/muconate lactonizing protein [Deinococcus sp.]